MAEETRDRETVLSAPTRTGDRDVSQNITTPQILSVSDKQDYLHLETKVFAGRGSGRRTTNTMWMATMVRYRNAYDIHVSLEQ